MVIHKHIAYRFLTDDKLAFEIVEATHSSEWQKLLNDPDSKVSSKIATLYDLVRKENQTPYIITESVLENLSLLKISKKGEHFDWTFFKNLKDQKVTFILPDNVLIRMVIHGEIINLFHLGFNFTTKTREKGEGHMKWIMYFLNRNTGELCEHFEHQDVKDIEETVYKFLCFFYLSDNQEEIIMPGKVHGTRKSGKVLNNFNFPITIVNSKWNITSIRNEGFGVSGHFATRWTGAGRNIPKVVFIEPFEKEGYIRKAKKPE